MTFKNWVVDLFKDERGSVSVKPVIAILGAIFLCVAMAVSVIDKSNYSPSEGLINAVMVITAVGMGADSIDKFTAKKTPPTE